MHKRRSRPSLFFCFLTLALGVVGHRGAEAAGPLKIGFAYVGPVGDAGWTFAHDKARKAVEAEFGPKVTTIFVENVPEAADAERVLRDMVKQGCGLIFGTTFGYMGPMLKVAATAPAVKFEHATGYKTAPNLGTYDSRTYEGAYMAGVIAGGMTKTNSLGVVASIPIPEVIRNIDSFTLGAQSVNPKVTTHVVWINKWFDPPKESEGALALMNDGADVLMQNTDSSAVLQAAEKAGKHAFGWDSDMAKYGPKAHLGSAVINWAPYYKKSVKDVLDGTWKSGQTWWGVKEGAIDSGLRLAGGAGGGQEEARHRQGRPEERQVRDLEGTDRRSGRQDGPQSGRDGRRQVPARDQLLRERGAGKVAQLQIAERIAL